MMPKRLAFAAVILTLVGAGMLYAPLDRVFTPTPQSLSAVVVEESSRRTADHAAILGSKEFRALFAGVRLAEIDRDNGEDMTRFLERVKGRALPVLILVGEDGVEYFCGPLPGSVEAAKGLVAKIKGKST